MRLKPVIFFLIVGSLSGYLIYREAGREGGPGAIRAGQEAPDFAIKDENGREVRLSDFRGNLVFINFWATWCPPCVKEMPEMQVMNEAFAGRKFKMMAISLDTDWSYVRKFYDEHNLVLPTYLDPGRHVASLYRVFKYPETFLIDGNGVVVQHVVGEKDWADPRVMAGVEAMIPDGGTEQEDLLSTR